MNWNKLFTLACIVFSTICLGQKGSDQSQAIDPPSSKDKYHIFFKGKRMGDYDLERTVSGDKTTYTSKSVSTIKAFGKVTVVFDSKAVYQDDKLIESQVVSTKNGKPMDNILTVLKNDEYHIQKDGDVSLLTKDINHSAVVMYFKPPSASSSVFSERDGVFKTAKNVGSDVYTLVDKNGKTTSTFYYKDSKFEKAIIPFTLGEFSIAKTPD